MKILFAVICCDYKSYSLNECLANIIRHAPDADVLLNYEGEAPLLLHDSVGIQRWNWWGEGKNERKFDQDQSSRLTPICIARNMVMDYAQQSNYDYLVFVDSDILVPGNVLSILDHREESCLRSGVIPGRGIHSAARYFGTMNRDLGDGWMQSDYYSCGLLAIPKEIFWRTRFRWGMLKESDIVASEDPIFGSDVRNYLGYKWVCKSDVICQHIGELKTGETSQF